MTLTETIKNILQNNGSPTTPQELRDSIKRSYPEFYGTMSHVSNVEKGHYNNLDHALLAQIYSIVTTNDIFYCDRNSKPLKVSLVTTDEESLPMFEDYEAEEGTVYILKTDTYTKSGKEIIKIGYTSQDVNKRINQLYTTGVPYKFTVHATYTTRNYIELETALHKLLDRFKLNKSREFFTEDALSYIPEIVALNKKIQSV
jgi:biotin operon repressor